MRRSWRLPHIKGLKKFNRPELEFLLTHIAQVGRNSEVMKLFHDRFGKTVTLQYLIWLTNESKFKDAIKTIREDFSRNLMTSSYLANKRIRVERYTDIYEKAMDLADYKLASSILSSIREEVEPKAGSFNFINVNQSNEYYSMTLDDIRRKKAEVLERLERKKITSELSKTASPVTIIDGGN